MVAFGFRPPVYHLACRDQWIGWGIGARAQNRGRVIGLSRFLLRPGLRVPNLASQCYGRILRQVGRDAEANLKAREIAREDAETAIRTPALREAARPPREIVTRPYFDKVTGETMLLRAVIEESENEIAVVTLYKTSKLQKYLPEGTT